MTPTTTPTPTPTLGKTSLKKHELAYCTVSSGSTSIVSSVSDRIASVVSTIGLSIVRGGSNHI